ncbi:MAG: hypothetical protein QGF18_05945 [Alphaproteobacteria bacterium]|jgi:hypothetical protein|nr:hypothetical protein [Rhodospirillaceae bacterium]MDP6031528.1 hypothetical protein [Alphaproteobacteria bacterium]MDP7183388.1 hypothetical protein [Alphaproteobacteria bacterium]MDP7190593.1 hypothetical protein [Alphaproteobacteria bacterium]HJO88589.1 hypothetical protein [Alphaproteobacteria bacterium]|tara:strand:- start:406 stop:594 length:189 start_codon:yes stop_codon:yes gene_type:complete
MNGENISTAGEAGAPDDVLSLDLSMDASEPWEDWETSLCLWSLGFGLAGLVVLGVLVNVFIL